MAKTIQEQLDYINTYYEGTHKEDLLVIWNHLKSESDKHSHFVDSLSNKAKEIIDIWHYLHKQERPEPILQVKLLHPDAKVPTRGSEGAIGWDLYKPITRSPLVILAQDYQIVDLGIAVKIPHGHYGRIAPRSGLAAKQGINVLAGVIDEDYTGEVKVILHNTTHNNVVIDQTKAIAQLILERADIGKLMVVEELLSTVRGSGGFGSTDNKETSNETTQTS